MPDITTNPNPNPAQTAPDAGQAGQQSNNAVHDKGEQTPPAVTTPTKEEEPKVPRSQMEAVAAELKKYKDAEKQKAEQEAIAKGEFDKVLSEKDSRIAELENKIKLSETKATVENLLTSANINPTVKDFVSDYIIKTSAENGKSIDEIVNQLVTEKPDLFTAPTQVGRSGIGTTPTNTTDLGSMADNASLGEYLKSNT